MVTEKYINKIEVIKEKDYILIHIKEDCSLDSFIKEKEKYLNEEIYIPMSMIILKDDNFINQKLKKQKIYHFKKNNFKYIISISDKQINISQRKVKDKLIYETQVEIRGLHYFSVKKYIHDLNNNTKECRVYNSNNSNVLTEEKLLNKKEALSSAQDLFDNIKNLDGFYKTLNIYPLYRRLNLIPTTWYNPIVSDDVITLSSTRYSSIDTINNVSNCIFYIILNETKEEIGNIVFNLKKDGFTYDGNVGYEIKDEFRNKEYASRALKLLKEIIKSNRFSNDKYIYISTLPDDISYQTEIEENAGEIVYDGKVPENDRFNFIHGISKVKVYQIKINNNI